MYRLGSTGQKWLKCAHLLIAGAWVGGAVSLLVLYLVKRGLSDGDVIYGVNASIRYIDMKVVVTCAFGSLITGLVYSLFTGWGFFKQPWQAVKWLVTVSAIVFGTFWLGPWEAAMTDLSDRLRDAALTDPEYLANQARHLWFGLLQTATLAATVVISVLKPWKRWRRDSRG